MKKYKIEITEIAKNDLEEIIFYLKHNLTNDIVANNYKDLFRNKIKTLENIAGSTQILDKGLTGHENIRKVNVRKYAIFYIINEDINVVTILRIGHLSMDLEKYLKDI